MRDEKIFGQALDLLSRLLEVEGSNNGMVASGPMDELACAWCSRQEYDPQHDDDCPWRQAKQFVETHRQTKDGQ